MRLPAAYLVTACFALASASVHNIALPPSGRSELNIGGALLPRQQPGGRMSLQTFAGALGGAAASAITNSGDPDRPFEVDGDTFPDYETAANRACDNQKNICADLANNGPGTFEVGECDQQNERCKSAATSAPLREFPPPVLVGSNDEFDFFCDA